MCEWKRRFGMEIGLGWGKSRGVGGLLSVGLSRCGVVISGVFVSPGRPVVLFLGIVF